MLYFVVCDKFCEMCFDIFCMNVCLSGVLSEEFKNINDVCMGLVVLFDYEICFNW